MLLADAGWRTRPVGAPPDHRLVAYLVATHHGRIRVSLPPESTVDAVTAVVTQGGVTAAITKSSANAVTDAAASIGVGAQPEECGNARTPISLDEFGRLGVLGVVDGDRTPPVRLSTGEHFAAQRLRTASVAELTEGALAARTELGPFRIAFLESLVRVADWRSSARHDGPAPTAD
jgi:hypothetical protein